MQDHTADSHQVAGRVSARVVEEAQALSARSLALLRPTIRAQGSELWFSWNPRRKTDPVDVMLSRQRELPTGASVVRANWRTIRGSPAVLDQERQDCLRDDPDQYAHIWEGDYASVLDGAYLRRLAEANAQRTDRHGFDRRSADDVRAIYWRHRRQGRCLAIWIAQFVGREIRVLDYYEAVASRSQRM